MRLRIPVAAFLFLLGAVAALTGRDRVARGAPGARWGTATARCVASLLAEIATSSVDSAVKAGLPE